uniref:CASP-like protein n=1 Tax=Wollemia nobilis TaxID=56998 RepID=A0A0C9S889_9CONI
MATQIKPGHSESGNEKREMMTRVKEGPSSTRFFIPVEFVLRAAAMGATLAAAIVMVTSKQTVLVPVPVFSNSPPILLPLPSKYHYSPAFVYFVVANAVACGYALLSIIIITCKLKGSVSSVFSAWLLSITDLVMVALVLSGASAATAIGYVGWKGNSHLNWGKVCNIYDTFCIRVAAAVVVSFIGIIVFIVLILMSVSTLYQHTKVR